MPALITHYLFGIKAMETGIDALARARSAPEAYLLGCQGPDPLLFSATTARGSTLRELAKRMHREHVAEALDTMRSAADELPEADRGRGLAYACGFLAHYALDSIAHPYVYASVDALAEAAPELCEAKHEMHSIIESDIDCGMLDLLAHTSTAELAPVDVLSCDSCSLTAAGAVLAQCAMLVFNLDVRPSDLKGSLDDMRLCYRSIEPAGSDRSRRVGSVERVARKHSIMESLAHRLDLGADNPWMNPQGLPWTNPCTQKVSAETFPQIFDRAFAWYLDAIEKYVAMVPASRIVSEFNYLGRPLAV